MSEQDQPADEGAIIENRRAKLRAMRENGVAFPNDFRRDSLAQDLQSTFQDTSKEALEEGAHEATVAGRIMLKRVMGSASFITIADMSGRLQCYLRKNDLPDGVYNAFKKWDIGDHVGVRGVMMRTNKGELSVHASELRLLNKSVRPLPDKFHGLADQEQRYRQRYVDLIMNDEVRRTFVIRSRVIEFIRNFFIARGFLEVETPMMHMIPGGATARPFTTHHNALGIDLYLRVAPELYLKRLVVGGFEKVFEINRNFRNEGTSTRHNPEFTMLEFYEAYKDYRDLLDLTEELLRGVARHVCASEQVTWQGTVIDFGKPFVRQTMKDAIISRTNLTDDVLDDDDALRVEARTMGVQVQSGWGRGKVQMEMFEACVEKTLTQPTFITEYPAEVSPLARRKDGDDFVTDRFELFVGGREIANGFSELNDPEDQAARFRAQAEQLAGGDNEAMHFDADYIRALEYGLPPTAGEGIGIDRLVMLLTDSASIRDVLLFPYLRPEEPQ